MDAGRHPLIELVTNAEVVGCDGEPGDFRVRVRKNPRYVREDLCVACGLCVDPCPQVGGNEFDVGLKARKAIYRPFPQSVPSTYVVDPESCLNFLGFLTEKQRLRLGKVERLKRKKRPDYPPNLLVCGHCEDACDVKAIDFDMLSEDVERIRAVAAVLRSGDVLVADANTGWLTHEAARVVNAVRDVNVYIEQPCASYEECLSIRERTPLPFVLDESITDLGILLRAHNDRAMDAVNVKISKFGGLTRAAQVRDMCVSLGIAMTIEDSWGGDVTTAAIAHLAHSTPTELLFTATDFNSYVTVSTAEGAPQRVKGRMAAATEPGLGITPRMDVLGDPVLDVS